MSRAKARLKFLVDDYGAEGVRKAVEERLGRTLEDLAAPVADRRGVDHIGLHPQKQDGLVYIGVPVFAGQVNSEQLVPGRRPGRVSTAATSASPASRTSS